MKRLFCSLYYSSASTFPLSLTLAAAMDAPHLEELERNNASCQTATASMALEQSSLGKRPYEATQEQAREQVETDSPEPKRQRHLNSQSLQGLHAEAKAANPEAQLKLANIYGQGIEVPQNLTTAVEWLQKAAEQGHALAQGRLGVAYWEGQGVDRDPQKAVEWFRKAAEQGHRNAQYRLGVAYWEGKGVDQDSQKGLEWFRKAAEQGHRIAQGILGMAYWEGKGVDQDLQKAVEWFREAAEQEHAWAQCTMGKAYWEGKGVDLNPQKAVEWFRKAAEQGYALAQGRLGLACWEGKGLDQDPQKAVEWFRKAADQGMLDAQYMLGKAYWEGKGVAKDTVMAIEWYIGAAIRGSESAQQAMGEILGKLQNPSITAPQDISNRWQQLNELVQPFTVKNYLQAGLHRPGWGLGRVNNPAVASFFATVADFGREISRIIKGFNSPGFMVKFAKPQAIADFTSVNEERHIQRYSRLNNLVCFGTEAVEIGNLLHQMVFDDHKIHPLSFAQITTLISHQIDKVSHSIEQLEIESVTLDALIQSCAPVLNDEEYVKKHQQNLRQLAQRYASEEETVANLVTESQFQKQAEEFRNRLFAEYLNKMSICENALEHQRERHKMLKDQLSTVSTIRSELLELLDLGVNERNNRLRALYPWLG